MISDELAMGAVKRVYGAINDHNDGMIDVDTAERLYGTRDINCAMACGEADIKTVVQWASQELARREAERAERAKLIDAEWCLANGAISMTPEFVFFRIPDGHNLNVYLDPKDPYVAYGSNSFPAVTTRGQLLDLLSALKGGEA